MKKLEFATDNGTAFYAELKQKLNEHFAHKKEGKKGNRIMRFKMILYFSLFIIFYTSVLFASSTIIFMISYLLMGLAVLLVAFNVSHDAAHGVAVKQRKWNKFLFQLSFNLQGNNAYVWGKHHNESHHVYTNVEASDIDVLNNPLVRMTAEQPLKWFHRYQYLYVPVLYLLYSLNWFLFRELLLVFKQSSRTISIEIPKREVIKLILFKMLYVVYMIGIPIAIGKVSIGVILLSFLLNHFMVSIIFTAVLGVSHLSDFVAHPVPKNNRLEISWPTLQLITSVDYHPSSKFLNWTLGGFNAHSLHHLLPDICHVHYPEIVPLFRTLSQKHNLQYLEMSYWEAYKSHFRFLKKMGSQINPQIPVNYER